MVKLFTFFSTLCLVFLATTSSVYGGENKIGLGITAYQGNWNTGDRALNEENTDGTGIHVSLSVREVYGRHEFGFGIDYDSIFDSRIIGLRALDYQRRFSQHFALGAFLGAATLDSGLPQNGYYLGVTGTRKNVFNKKVNVEFALRYGSGLARDKNLASDSQAGQFRDIFLDFWASTIALSWSF